MNNYCKHDLAPETCAMCLTERRAAAAPRPGPAPRLVVGDRNSHSRRRPKDRKHGRHKRRL